MWILPKNQIFSHSALASEDSTSDLSWQSQLLAQSVTSRGKLIASTYWLKGWRRGGWIPHLFGRICEPSMADRGVALWISSLAATRANHFQLPEKEKEAKTHVTCGQPSENSLKISPPLTLSSRMFPTIYLWDLNKSQMSFRNWVIKLRQECFRRRRLTLLIKESGYLSLQKKFSLWRTPATTDVGTPCRN